MKPNLVYSPGYDLSLWGLERLHPFDAHRYSRAWSVILEQGGHGILSRWTQPPAPVSDQALLRVHTPAYLDALHSSAAVARALEFWPCRFVPNALLQSKVLRPMRLAVEGTVIATDLALRDGIAMNIGGGYHHAFRDHGEGFCVFADVAVSIAAHRATGRLGPHDPVVVIDLDAHRGNGFEDAVRGDASISILDLYNFQVYPGLHQGEPDQFPFMVPVRGSTTSAEYLQVVREEVSGFLTSVPRPQVAFYVAGTDIVSGDRLGGMQVSPEAVGQRDRLVVEALAGRGIPTVIVTGGGYSKGSHRLVAQLALYVCNRFT